MERIWLISMIYLLDTNTCIQYITQRSSSVVRRVARISTADLGLCDIVKLELYYGVYKSQQQAKNLALLSEFFSEMISLPFNSAAAEICGQLRAQLAVSGTPIGTYDLQIAAIALANDLILVTHNICEFSRIEELRYEDWER